MLGPVVKLDAPQQGAGRRVAQRFFETGTELSVEIIEHQVNLAGRSPGAIEQFLHKGNELGQAQATCLFCSSILLRRYAASESTARPAETWCLT